MGLDWEVYLENKNTKDKIILDWFCGWNSRTILEAAKDYFTADEDEFHYTLKDKAGFINWLLLADKANSIFSKYSARQIEEDEFSDKTWKKFKDLCYDMGINMDTFNIYTMQRLGMMGKFFRYSALLDDNNENWVLKLYESY